MCQNVSIGIWFFIRKIVGYLLLLFIVNCFQQILMDRDFWHAICIRCCRELKEMVVDIAMISAFPIERR